MRLAETRAALGELADVATYADVIGVAKDLVQAVVDGALLKVVELAIAKVA